jgi:tripartite ATP-independent transporter DctM subunit
VLSLLVTISFLGLMVLRVPVSFAVGLSTLIALLYGGKNLAVIPQFMHDGVHSFPLMAVPFFILAGNLFTSLGLSRRIFEFAQTLVGHWKGGLAQVVVVAEIILSGISGSALADAAGLGLISIPQMVTAGYSLPFSTAIVLSASVIGPIIPPSIAFVIYGVTAEVSIGRLFLAGVIPGFLIAGSLMLLNYYYAAKEIEKGAVLKRKALKEVGKNLKTNFLTLITPLIIVLGLLLGVVTPTEVGILAIVYSLLVSWIYKDLTAGHLYEALESSVRSVSLIMYIIAVSTVAGWIYAIEGTPQKIAEGMLAISEDKHVILLFINIFLLILGCLLEPIPAMIITTPIFMPIIRQLGIDPVHFGVIICYNLTIGIITPPMGIGLYVMMGVAKISFEDLVKACMPLLIPLLISLFVLTYLPGLSLFLPNLVMGK